MLTPTTPKGETDLFATRTECCGRTCVVRFRLKFILIACAAAEAANKTTEANIERQPIDGNTPCGRTIALWRGTSQPRPVRASASLGKIGGYWIDREIGVSKLIS